MLAVSLSLGVLVPPLAALLYPLVTPALVVLTGLVLLRIDPVEVLGYLRRPGLVAAMLAVGLLLSPVLVHGLARAAGLDGPLGDAVVIAASGCAATSAPAFARLFGLDGEIALVVSVLSILLVPFTAPPLALGLLGLDLAISLGGLMARLALVVLLPAALAMALRWAMGPHRLAAIGPAVDGAVVLAVVTVGVGIMAGMQARIRAEPEWVAGGLALAFALNLGLTALGTLLFVGVGRRLACSAGLLTGNRNAALFLAVLPAGTEPRILLFFALCQVPMFLSPFLLRPVYRRLIRG